MPYNKTYKAIFDSVSDIMTEASTHILRTKMDWKEVSPLYYRGILIRLDKELQNLPNFPNEVYYPEEKEK